MMHGHRLAEQVNVNVNLTGAGGEEAPINRLLRTTDDTYRRLVREDSSCRNLGATLGALLVGCLLMLRWLSQ